MNEPHLASKTPFPVNLESGKTYFWCACGLSKTQPFCDGSHKGTGFSPVAYKAEISGQAYLCGCKRTQHRPMCDGSHANV